MQQADGMDGHLTNHELLAIWRTIRVSYEDAHAILVSLAYQPLSARELDGIEAQIDTLAADAGAAVATLRALLGRRRAETGRREAA